MTTLKFKTNINCSGCVEKVKPFLDDLEGVKWQVDTSVPDKVLTENGEKVSEKDVQEKLVKANFQSEILK